MNLSKKLYLSQWCLLLLALTFVALWAPLTVFGQPFDKTTLQKSGVTAGSSDEAFAAPQYFSNVPARFANSGMNDNPASLTEPVRFPHQDPNRSNTQSCPIVLNNGDVLLIWSESGSLAYSRSIDGGQTWESPGVVASTPGYTPDNLCGIYTQNSRVIIIWRNTQILDLMMSFYDVNGSSWSNPIQITFLAPNERWTSLSQTLDGTLWLFYSDDVPGNARDVFYRTSTDDGNNWSGQQTFRASLVDESFATVVSADPSTLLAFYQDNSSTDESIYHMSSTDGGQNWSSPVVIGQVYQDEFRPRALRQPNGTLWLIYGANSPTPVLGTLQNDIYYITSSDGGSNWNSPVRFTYYVGNDDGHNVALINDQPFVSFNSYRWSINWYHYQIWYGIIGETVDSNPPPALLNQYVISPYQNSAVTMRTYVDDESGISAVSGSYDLNGVQAGSFPMYDDGQHNDVNPGDNIWAGQIGPFQVGDNIAFNYQISDIDIPANNVTVYVNGFGIPYAHDTGNMILSWHENSGLAEGLSGFIWGSSAYWPASAGHDYLYTGGLWVGAQVNGEPRVMNHYYNQVDWQQTPGTFYGMVPGPADQVGTVTYDDQQALSTPIGLEVTQETHQWSTTDPDHDDFIIIRYTIKNTSGGNLDGVSVGLFTDPDLSLQTSPAGAADDLGKYEADRKLAYLYDNQNNPGGYFGIKLLGGSQPHTVNIAPNGGPLDSQDDATRYFWMWTGPQPDPTTPADYRILMTHALYNLAAGASQTVAFGIVLGNGVEELRANADAMELRYAQLFGTQTPPENLFAIDKLNGEAALYWNPGYEPGSTLLSYNVYRTDSPSPIGNVPWDQTYFVDTSVNNGQIYFYYVTAVYNTGESDPSNETIGYPMSLPDEAGKVVSYARPGGRAYGIAFDGSSVWMADYYFDQIRQFDPNTWEFMGQIPAPEGGGSYGLAWDGASLWVAYLGSGRLYQIELSGNILQYISLQQGTATGVACENGHVWTMDRTNGSVYKYDASSGQLLQTFPLPDFQGSVPRSLAYIPDRGTFIVGVTAGNNHTEIYEVTTSDFTLTGLEFDFGMEYDPGNGEFYSSVRGVAYNPLTGNYWIGDVWSDVVYEAMPFAVVFQAEQRIDFNAHDFSEGNIHCNGDINFSKGNPSIHKGNINLVGDIEVREKNTIEGDVSAGGMITLFRNAVVTGELNANAAIAAIPLPALPAFSYGSTNITVPKKGLVILPPGDYKNVNVQKNATLRLCTYANCTYNMKQLNLAEGATLEIDASGRVTININDNLDANKNAAIELTGGATGNVAFNVKGASVMVRDKTVWLGSLLAPNAQVVLQKNAFFKGNICAKKVELQKGVVAVHHGSSTPLPKLLPNRADEEEIAEFSNLPTEYALGQNYPNPFNPTTTIQYQLPKPVKVVLEIFNVKGQKVTTLVNEEMTAGYYSVVWDAREVSSGVYFYRIEAGEFSDAKKLVVIK